MKKRYFLLILLFGLTILGYRYIYKSHRDIKSENISYEVNSSNILHEFSLNIETATEKYLDKVIEIKGFVTKVDNYVLEIDKKISCYFDETIKNNQLINKQISIKGRCIGFDELLKEIKIDQCTVTEIY